MRRALAWAALLWLAASSALAEPPELRRIPRDGFVEFQYYAPDPLPPAPKVVVALHGCKQNGALYAAQSGWLDLARHYGFIVLAPTFSGNPNQCWEWFDPVNIGSGRRSGATQIANAVDQLRQRLQRPEGANYVTGLSAGASMALSVLASYPEKFSAGAVFAGLPLGAAIMPKDRYDYSCKPPPPGRSCPDKGGNCCCTDDFGMFSMVPNLREACAAMEYGATAKPEEWVMAARRALPEDRPVRPLLVVHGTSDATVDCANATDIATQWAALAKVAAPAASCQTGGTAKSGPVELRLLQGFDHFQPVMPGCGEHDPDKYFLNAPVCGAREAWEFFGK
jgi:poly(3-hydroxybutyrate) depolymerase